MQFFAASASQSGPASYSAESGFVFKPVRASLGFEKVDAMHARRSSPALPLVHGLDYYGERVPADIPGGDFFDFFPLRATLLAVAVGECFGSPVSTGLVTPCLHSLLHDAAAQDPGDLVGFMRQANRAVWRVSAGDFYTSMFYAHADTFTGELQYINAGHEQALLIRKRTGRVHDLESTGTVLGLTARPNFRRRSLPAEPGDILIILTDGVTESVNSEGKRLSRSAILRTVERHPEANAYQLADELLRAAGLHGRDSISRDCTVAVVRFKDRAEQLETEEAEEEIAELAFSAA
jgi:sigma-B regulation protein RsbU (phosphoserine phosphatase)